MKDAVTTLILEPSL